MNAHKQYILHVLDYQFQLKQDLIISFFGSIYWPVFNFHLYRVRSGVHLFECHRPVQDFTINPVIKDIRRNKHPYIVRYIVWPSIFSFAGLLSIFPYEPLEVHACLLRLHFLGEHRRTHLTRHWCALVSITEALLDLYFSLGGMICLLWEFSVTVAWHVLSVLRHSFVAHSGSSLERLLESLLLGEILFYGRSQRPWKTLGRGFLIW